MKQDSFTSHFLKLYSFCCSFGWYRI